MLALHTNQRHGIDRYELRELAGLMFSVSICSPEYAAKHRELLAARGGIAPKRRQGAPARSTAGREAQSRNKRIFIGREYAPAARERRRAGSKKAGAIRGAQLKKPRRPCVICGVVIPYKPGNAQAKVCGDACLRENRARHMAANRKNGVV